MIKQLLINGQVNRYTLSNRARQAIAFQYITDTRTLRLIDTYNNVALDLVAEGDNALTSSAMEKIWQYIENKVDTKTGGAFHFKGTVDSLQALSALTNTAKIGDVYQVIISAGQYDPNTGTLIPSSVTRNDKEYALASITDPNTGLDIGRQWVELGFNFDVGSGIISKDWVEQFMQTKQQAQAEHEALSTYISTVSGDLRTYINITAQNLNEYINETAEGLSAYVDSKVTDNKEYVDTVSAAITSWVEGVVSTTIIQYVNVKVVELYGALSALSTYVDGQDAVLSTDISNLKKYVDDQDQVINNTIDAFSTYVLDRMDTVDGGFVTNVVLNNTVENITNQHQKDLTFILYDDNGVPINYP